MKKIIFIILIFSSHAFAANWYVDPDYGGGNGASNGSFSRPFTTIAQINAQAKSAGDDLYFKAGSRLVAANRLLINWSGTAENRAIVGAYSGENDFTLGGNSRPILDGNNHTVPTRDGYDGMIMHQNRTGYVTIQDIEIYNSGAHAIWLGQTYQSSYLYTDGFYEIKNCVIYRSWRGGITIARSSKNIISNNELFETSYGFGQTTAYIRGASIEFTGMNNPLLTRYNTIRGNIVRRGYEGIGIYNQANYTTVENNTVFDCRTYNIYITRGIHNIVRNNLVYATENTRAISGSRGAGIVVMAEIDEYAYEPPAGWNQIYGNYLAGLSWGFMWGLHPGGAVGFKDMNIYANRFVDCASSIQTQRNDLGTWSGNKIDANYSFHFNDAYIHANLFSPQGTTWSGNYFKTPPNVSGNAMTGAFYNQVTLQKTTGWRALTPGAVTKEDFAFSGETGSCSTNYTLCDAVGCSEYWPDYYFCDAGGCQPQACETVLDCEDTASLCNEADCATYWPTYIWTNGQCLPPGFEPTPFANKPLRPSSLHLPWRPTSTLPPLDTRSGERR